MVYLLLGHHDHNSSVWGSMLGPQKLWKFPKRSMFRVYCRVWGAGDKDAHNTVTWGLGMLCLGIKLLEGV